MSFIFCKCNKISIFSAIKFNNVLCTDYVVKFKNFIRLIFTVKFNLFMIYVLFHRLSLSFKFQNKCICLNVFIMILMNIALVRIV